MYKNGANLPMLRMRSVMLEFGGDRTLSSELMPKLAKVEANDPDEHSNKVRPRARMLPMRKCSSLPAMRVA